MNTHESALITRSIFGAAPQQHVDKYTPEMWHKLLEDLDYDDAMQAVISLGKRQPFISPSEIRTEVQRVQRERIKTAHDADPCADEAAGADPNNVEEWLAAVKAEYQRITAGGGPRPAPALPPHRPVAQLLAGMGARMPNMPGSSSFAHAALELAREQALRAKHETSSKPTDAERPDPESGP